MMKKKRILITGVSGLLGNNLARAWRHDVELYGIFYRHPVKIDGVALSQLDMLDRIRLKEYIDEVKPQIIVNCAALTNIDYCEEHPAEAKSLNADLVSLLVEAIGETDIKLVHISTDNVFDGQKGDYREADPVNPVNAYGHTKLAGEIEALKNPHSLLARTNIFGWNIQDKCSLAEWCIKELSRGNRIKGFKDVYFSSVYTFDLADLLRSALEQNLKGIYHVAGSSAVSKYDFLVRTAELFGLDPSLIEPIEVARFPFKARRGRNLGLRVSKLQAAIESPVPSTEESLKHFYRDAGLNAGIKSEA